MESFKLEIKDLNKILANRGLEVRGAVQMFIDNEVLRQCNPYVPKDTGELIRSGTAHTKIGSGEVKYRTPYARRWYYRPAQFTGAPKRGNYWFERMKQNGGLESILKGAKRIAGAR